MGIRHQTAVDSIGVSFPPLPHEWTHFTIEALVVTSYATMGVVILNTRHQFAGPGDTLATGTFKGPQVTTGATLVPQWHDMLSQSVNRNIAVVPGKPLKIQIDRSFGNPSDTLDDTLWFLAVRVVRVRRNVA